MRRHLSAFLILALLLSALPAFAQSGARGRSRGPRNFELTVQSNVPIAQVTVGDQQPKPGVPVVMTLPAGEHVVEVTANGYRPFRQTIDLSADQTVTANLELITHQLSVVPNVGNAEVVVAGQNKGRGRYNEQLVPGRYEVRVTAPGYLEFSSNVDLNGDREVSVNLQPAPATVRLQVPPRIVDRDVPGAANMVTIFVDGRPVVGDSFEVQPGRHTVKVRSGGWAVEVERDFEPGRTYTIQPNLSVEIR